MGLGSDVAEPETRRAGHPVAVLEHRGGKSTGRLVSCPWTASATSAPTTTATTTASCASTASTASATSCPTAARENAEGLEDRAHVAIDGAYVHLDVTQGLEHGLHRGVGAAARGVTVTRDVHVDACYGRQIGHQPTSIE